MEKNAMNANSKTASSTILEWTEQGRVPDGVIRAGIRRLCRQRLRDIEARDIEASARRLEDFVRMMDRGPVAPVPERANEQHYEVPPEFFQHALGAHRKYSCCHWDDDTTNLDEAEAAALRITCERAGIRDGMDVLELGCGWGSLSLWIAENYPGCRVMSVSNSSPQRRYIEARAADYRRSHREEMEKVPAPRRLESKEYAPIRAMFEELQRRLNRIPTNAQRRRADASVAEARAASNPGAKPAKTPPPE